MLNLNKVFPRLSIRNKLAIGFALVALLPLAGVTVVGVLESVRLIHRSATSTLSRDIELAEAETARTLSSAQEHVRFFARMLVDDRLGSQRRLAPELARVGGEIRHQLAVEPALWRVRVFADDGEQVLFIDSSGVRTAAWADDAAPYYAWRAQEVAADDHVIIPVEVRHGATTVAALAIVVPIHRGDGTLLAVVVGEARAARTFVHIEDATDGYEGTTGIVDPSGQFLYHTTRKREWARLLAVRRNETLRSDFSARVSDQVLAGQVGEVQTTDGQLVAFRPLDLGPGGTGAFTLYRAVPVARLRAPVAAFLARVGALGLAVVGLVLLGAVLAANQFTRPILAMRRATAQIAAGVEPVLAPVDTNDEIEDLANDLAGMAHTISTQRADLHALLSEQGRALERTRAALAEVVDHSADAIIMTDARDIVAGWNQGATRLFEYAVTEAVGASLEGLIGRDGPGVERELAFFTRELALHGAVVNYATERRTREGRMVPVSLTLTRIRSPDGTLAGHSYILRDNRLQTQLDEQLSRSERLVAVSVLAAGLAHEVNTPLAILGNRIEVMQRELVHARPEVLREDLDVLAAHVARLGAVTSGLLRFAREDDGNEAYLDIGGLARRVTGLLERIIVQRRLRLDVAIDDGLATVRANERAIETVLVNLLINAADAAPPGGIVSLRIVGIPEEQAVQLTVTDTGPGVPRELRERIFEPFFTTKPEGRGTGLGLTVCRTIIERHGGRVDVGEADGGGARFTVTLYHEPARFTWMSRAS